MEVMTNIKIISKNNKMKFKTIILIIMKFQMVKCQPMLQILYPTLIK
jgi:uncharacterized membrane protein (DUF441 family)